MRIGGLRLVLFCAVLAAGLAVAGTAVIATTARLNQGGRKPATFSWDASPAPDAGRFLAQTDSTRNSIMSAFDRPQTDAERGLSGLVDGVPDATTIRILAGWDKKRVIAWLVPSASVCVTLLTEGAIGKPVCEATELAASGGLTIVTDAAGASTVHWGSLVGNEFPTSVSTDASSTG